VGDGSAKCDQVEDQGITCMWGVRGVIGAGVDWQSCQSCKQKIKLLLAVEGPELVLNCS